MALTLLRLLALLCLARKASCDYCEWDLCGSEQYCCGDNLCCDYVYRHWYFWVGLVFLLLLVSACGGIFRYYYRQWYDQPQPCFHFPPSSSVSTSSVSLSSPAYTSLPTHISNRDPHFQITQDCLKVDM